MTLKLKVRVNVYDAFKEAAKLARAWQALGTRGGDGTLACAADLQGAQGATRAEGASRLRRRGRNRRGSPTESLQPGQTAGSLSAAAACFSFR